MTTDTHALTQQLQSAGVAHADAVAALVATSIPIAVTRTELSTLALGASRFGGTPDVTTDFVWPRHRERPLTFLAQLDLSTLHAAPSLANELSASGWLLFFYDVAETPMGFDPLHQGGARVLYLDVPRAQLRRIEHPDVASAGGPFEPCALHFTSRCELPDWNDRILDPYRDPTDHALEERYRAVEHALRKSTEVTPNHHLLGHPQLVQGDIRGQCALVTQGIYCGDPSGFRDKRATALLQHASDEWVLLLQLDNDETEADWLWGDQGRVYFLVRRDDLATKNFDRAWLVLQCTG